MPIGQLLASITGEKAATPTIPSSRPSNIAPAKRKADDDGKASTIKSSRPTSAVAPNANANVFQPSRPYAGSSRLSSFSATRPSNERPATSASKKPSLNSTAKPSLTSAAFSASPRTTPTSSSLTKRSTPPTATSSATPDSAKAPKKGSIAEIKARAAAQQARLQGIGKIQHKPTEKQTIRRDREDTAAEGAKPAKKALKPGIRSGVGPLSFRIGQGGPLRNGNGISHLDRARGAIQKPEAGRTTKAPLIEERKVKKAALATTGYRGSARPVAGKEKPSAARRSNSPAAGRGPDRGQGKRPNPMGMFSKPRRRQDDEYDEDLDDFVVDDEDEEEEEPGYGGRYRYADDDDESDMEAGFSDVEVEESAAAKAARYEDLREEKILEERKRAKEARRREALKNRR